ncbi:SHOCT domain-containing protein [Microbacterium sp.]|uniref:SHOCT domain-containing protein n=1 Tax=Microbacterium sp. TaxID=51671 RepID=UPI0039C9D8D6
MGRPGLLGMAARTAVIAGTATAVSGHVARRQYERAEERDAEHQYEVQQEAAMMASAPPPAPPGPTPPAAPAATDMVGELQRLADLRAQGVLSDAEFQAAKAKLLA